MSPKPSLLSGKEIVRAFESIGYYRVGQRGSHIKIRSDTTQITLIIPDHKEVDRWALKGILKDAEVSVEEFLKLLKQFSHAEEREAEGEKSSEGRQAIILIPFFLFSSSLNLFRRSF